jgi:uncharacterized protein (DUF433 family)
VAIRRPTAAGRIVRNPPVLGGEPIVTGTRIPVRGIVLASREYGGAEGALAAYPQLAPADVHDALAYYDTHKSETDRYIQANVDDDRCPCRRPTWTSASTVPSAKRCAHEASTS